MELFVVRIEEGALTPRLWELAPGDRLWMDCEAKGEFNLESVPRDANLVLVSSGTGIAPFVSLLRTYRAAPRWKRAILIHGARLAADLGYRAELEDLSRADSSVCYIPLVTREPETGSWTGLRGRVQSVLDATVFCRVAGTPLEPGNCHVFLCGNPDMIDSVAALLVARGFTLDSRDGPGNVHFERYW
jgi:ferredoxin/flavodoxin---NADP+ reductase